MYFEAIYDNPSAIFTSTNDLSSHDAIRGHGDFLSIMCDWAKIKNAKLAPICLSCQGRSNDMQHDLSDPDRGFDLRSNFQIDLSRSSYTLFEAAWKNKHGGTKISVVA